MNSIGTSSRRAHGRRILAALIAVAIGVGLAMAQGPGAAGAAPVTITFWTTTPTGLDALLAAFKHEHPEIIVDAQYIGGYDDMAQKVLAAVAGRQTPQLAQLGQRHGIPQIADSGALRPIEEFLTPADRADVLPSLWVRFTYKGKIWTMPFNTSTPSLWYNKDAFRAAGLDPDRPPKTWVELVADAKQLTRTRNGKVEQWGFGAAADTPWYFMAMVWQDKGTIARPDGSVNLTSPEAVEVLRFWRDLVHVFHVMPAAGHKTAEDDFVSGRVAMLYASVAARGDYQQKIAGRFALGDAFLPGFKANAVGIGGNSLGIFHATPEQERASWTLVQYLTSRDVTAAYSIKTGYVPIRKSALELPQFKQFLHDNPIAQVGIDQLTYLHAQGVNPADAAIWDGLVKAIERVETSPQAEPTAVLNDLQTQVNEYLARYR